MQAAPYTAPPPVTPQPIPVRINIATPERLKNEPLWYLIHFAPHQEQKANLKSSQVGQMFLVDSKGEIQGELPQRGPGWESWLPVSSAMGAEIKFPAKVPQRVPLIAQKGLAAGDYDVIAVGYLAARNENVAGARPTVEGLNAADVFFARMQVSVNDGATLTIGAEQTEFWDGINEIIRDWAEEEAAEAKKQSAPTRPTATPPDSSAPN
jgi:hypothetical protein